MKLLSLAILVFALSCAAAPISGNHVWRHNDPVHGTHLLNISAHQETTAEGARKTEELSDQHRHDADQSIADLKPSPLNNTLWKRKHGSGLFPKPYKKPKPSTPGLHLLPKPKKPKPAKFYPDCRVRCWFTAYKRPRGAAGCQECRVKTTSVKWHWDGEKFTAEEVTKDVPLGKGKSSADDSAPVVVAP